MTVRRSFIRLKPESRPPRKVVKGPKAQTIALPKGLTQKEAWRAAIHNAPRDFRGMKYDKKTGRTKLI